MKKIFTLCVVALMAVTTVKAQHEIGAIVGGLNGASYKYWFNNAMALQADLAVGLTEAATDGGSGPMWDFTLNPNFLYHVQLPQNFKVYVGGGVNIGMCSPLITYSYGYGYGGTTSILNGKFGVNADAGVSYDIQAAPIVLALDFRPGYGLMFNDGANASFFDWKLAFAVRYRF